MHSPLTCQTWRHQPRLLRLLKDVACIRPISLLNGRGVLGKFRKRDVWARWAGHLSRHFMNASSATRQRARRVRVLDTRGEGCGRKGDTSGRLCRPWWMAASLNGVEGTCPVCQLQLPLSELEAHVQVHFGLSQSSEDPILIDDDTPSVTCLQCGMDISISEYASHDAAHRYCIPLNLL